MFRSVLRICLSRQQYTFRVSNRPQIQQLHVLSRQNDARLLANEHQQLNEKITTPLVGALRYMAKKAKGGKGGKGNKAAAVEEDEVVQKEIDWDKIEKSMRVSVNYITANLEHIRAGAASAAMFDNLKVESDGRPVSLSQVAQVAVKDHKTVMINCFDPSLAPSVVTSIIEADMGLNPDIAKEGVVKVPIPKVTKEKRQALIKKCKEVAERAKVNLRGARGKGMDQVKHANLPKDEARAAEKRVQKQHDAVLKELDRIADKKIESLS